MFVQFVGQMVFVMLNPDSKNLMNITRKNLNSLKIKGLWQEEEKEREQGDLPCRIIASECHLSSP